LIDFSKQSINLLEMSKKTLKKSTAKKSPKRAAVKKTSATNPNQSREQLLQAARNAFATEGYDRTSTRDIAKAAGVNISLISYHFQGKEGLFRACLEELSQSGIDTVERVLKRPTSTEELKTRLQIFIEEFIQLHLARPDNSCIMMKELFSATPNAIVVDLFRKKFSLVFGKLIEFLAAAQKQKLIAPSVDVEIFGMMVMGCITHLMRTENMRKIILGVPGLLEPQQIDKTISQLANNLLNGILPR
jgi:AcrR family transcriptional regulator